MCTQCFTRRYVSSRPFRIRKENHVTWPRAREPTHVAISEARVSPTSVHREIISGTGPDCGCPEVALFIVLLVWKLLNIELCLIIAVSWLCV
jgi:hypothetical protein